MSLTGGQIKRIRGQPRGLCEDLNGTQRNATYLYRAFRDDSFDAESCHRGFVCAVRGQKAFGGKKGAVHKERFCHLFGVRADSGFCDWHAAKRALDQKLGDSVARFLLHDIRRTVATRLADLGVQPHVIEQILNHQSGHKAGIAGIYNRSSYEREVKAALAMWADQVRALVEGSERVVHMLPHDVNHAGSGH